MAEGGPAVQHSRRAWTRRTCARSFPPIRGALPRPCSAFGGFVAKYMGDGALIYFGYPQAHEHDAERAVRVGLDIIANVGRLATRASEPLKVRVGIATGLVVVGDFIGEGAAQARGIVGKTPNIAARLQALAEPDSIVIAESTRRLVGDLFEYRRPRASIGSNQSSKR